LKFRGLLMANDLTKALFQKINAHLVQQELLMRAVTIEGATIMAAAGSTKNARGRRDPQMHLAKKDAPEDCSALCVTGFGWCDQKIKGPQPLQRSPSER
jgi:hypothetical protein